MKTIDNVMELLRNNDVFEHSDVDEEVVREHLEKCKEHVRNIVLDESKSKSILSGIGGGSAFVATMLTFYPANIMVLTVATIIISMAAYYESSDLNRTVMDVDVDFEYLYNRLSQLLDKSGDAIYIKKVVNGYASNLKALLYESRWYDALLALCAPILSLSFHYRLPLANASPALFSSAARWAGLGAYGTFPYMGLNIIHAGAEKFRKARKTVTRTDTSDAEEFIAADAEEFIAANKDQGLRFRGLKRRA